MPQIESAACCNTFICGYDCLERIGIVKLAYLFKFYLSMVAELLILFCMDNKNNK